MNNIVEDSFGIIIKIMTVLRLFSPEEKLFHLFQGFFLYIILAVGIPVFTILYLLLEIPEDFDIIKMNYTATFQGESIAFIFKLYSLLFHGNRIRKCIYYFGSPYFCSIPQTQQEKEIVEDCVKTCRRNTRIFLSVIVIGLMNFNILPLFLNENLKLQLNVWLPFGDINTPEAFYTMYGYICMGTTYVALTGTMTDPLIGGLLYHAAGQIKILRYKLQHLGQHSNRETVYCEIKECIDHHNAILIFVEEFEGCFSLMILSQFAASVFCICFSCLVFGMTSDSFSIDTVKSMNFIAIGLAQIFFYCYYGTLLLEENNNLSTSIYMGSWYEYDIKCQKSLIVLMERAKRPMVVTAGSLIDLTLETFTLMVKRSYSLLTILKTYQ